MAQVAEAVSEEDELEDLSGSRQNKLGGLNGFNSGK